jgi:hypothetical protein
MSQFFVDEIGSESTGDVKMLDPLKVDVIDPSTGSTVSVNGVDISSPNTADVFIGVNPGLPIPYDQQVVIGRESLYSNANSALNVAIGVQTMYNADSAVNNVGIGTFALFNNNFGVDNVGVGAGALGQVSSSNQNSAIGNNSGNKLLSGSENTFLGSSSGPYFLNGNNNIFVGSLSGGVLSGAPIKYQESGDNNIHIGYNTRPATNTASNAITLGNSSHTVLRCAVTTITSLSDERDKKDIKELGAGLDFVKGLKPVEFVWNDRDDEVKRDIKDFGFIAQDLKKSQEDAELADTLKLVYEENPEKLEASYGKLVPILVKAIQELTAKVEALEAK